MGIRSLVISVPCAGKHTRRGEVTYTCPKMAATWMWCWTYEAIRTQTRIQDMLRQPRELLVALPAAAAGG